ncbi:hypothetical protein GCWU000321_01057 [Dialister invisus DSM 15470]|uniref:Uncharacterized protein n=1 Tax=Dialister invisus DSM 15470 TaxID=592028 RepID=C9LND6_9FIRM|nr:hypothetical protein GCWU000321_01057 [Dialister invisus DSM 15470]
MPSSPSSAGIPQYSFFICLTGTDSKKERRILYHIPKIRLKI